MSVLQKLRNQVSDFLWLRALRVHRSRMGYRDAPPYTARTCGGRSVPTGLGGPMTRWRRSRQRFQAGDRTPRRGRKQRDVWDQGYQAGRPGAPVFTPVRRHIPLCGKSRGVHHFMAAPSGCGAFAAWPTRIARACSDSVGVGSFPWSNRCSNGAHRAGDVPGRPCGQPVFGSVFQHVQYDAVGGRGDSRRTRTRRTGCAGPACRNARGVSGMARGLRLAAGGG